MARRYQRLTVELSRAGEDRLVADPPSGFLGIEVVEERPEGRRLLVWLDAGFPEPAEELWSRLGGRLLSTRQIPEEDWMAGWRSRSEPLLAGERFWLDPREPGEAPVDDGPPPGRWRLRLPARQAFGVGSHESTRLALELLEGENLSGLAVLDVGTGTGILAFAALLEGASPVMALEVDPLAAIAAGINRGLNDLWPAVVAGTCACLGPRARYDRVVANIIPEHLEPELPAIRRLLAPGGALVASGILSAEASAFLRVAALEGLTPRRSRTAGEWTAFVLGVSA